MPRPRGMSQQRLISSAGNANPFQLPSLGLAKQNLGMMNNFMKDPFMYYERTDKLLMQREHDRVQGDLEKPVQNNLKVHEKNIATRHNRAGKIRSIRDIKYNKEWGKDKIGKGKDQDDMRGDQGKNKINIFDEQDSNILKIENLARLGFDDRAMVQQDSESHSSASSSRMLEVAKPKQLEYLSKHRDQRESVKDFIENSRKILMAQISINDKTEETERLDEYIIMEEDKLKEAKNTFEEDKTKFEKYINDLDAKAKKTEADVHGLIQKKERLIMESNSKYQEIHFKKNEIKKIEEDLFVYKQQKEFLDNLAVYEGRTKQKVKKEAADPKSTTFITDGRQDDDFKFYFEKQEIRDLLTIYEEKNLTKI